VEIDPGLPSDDVLTGSVTEFDQPVGLGAVTSDDGTTYPFHCTQISGGSRSIPVGQPVTFIVRADRPKGPEAYAVTPKL
jgi:cold shock CspA family protein